MTRFRELRLQRGLSQDQLCKKYNEKYNRNYTPGAMSLIENDKRSPELNALLDFADFYGVSLDYLLGRDQLEEFSNTMGKGAFGRTWHLSEQLRNIVLGLYSNKTAEELIRREHLWTGSVSNQEIKNMSIDDTVADSTDNLENIGCQYARNQLKQLDGMSEAEENLEMLRSLLKQSVILAKRVEKNNKSWYRY